MTTQTTGSAGTQKLTTPSCSRLQEPDGENEVWDTSAAALRSPDPSAAQGFGMTEPMGNGQHIPLEQYRSVTRQADQTLLWTTGG